MGGFAWVTLATNDSYSLGALVLAHSLKQAGTAHQLVVLVTPGVTSSMREKLSTVFNLVQEVNILDSKDESNLRLLKRPELGITFTKLHCWRLTQFDKCVFLDADTLVLRNCDELFDKEELSAAPDVGWPDCFNSGVFVYRPSNETYEKIVQFALEKGSFDGGDQGLLNLYFSDWATKDISKHLPFIYNLSSTATYSYLPAFKQFGINAKIIHFIGNSKPWLQYFNTETRQVQPSPDLRHLEGILQHWWNIFCSLVHPNLSSDMARSTSDVTHTSISSRTSQHNDKTELYSSKNVNWDPWEEYDKKQSYQPLPQVPETTNPPEPDVVFHPVPQPIVPPPETHPPHSFSHIQRVYEHVFHPVSQPIVPPPETHPPPSFPHIQRVYEPSQIKPVESHNTNAYDASHVHNPPVSHHQPDSHVPNSSQTYFEEPPKEPPPNPPHVHSHAPDSNYSSQVSQQNFELVSCSPKPREPSPPVHSNEFEAAATVCKETTLHTNLCEDETDGGLAGAFAQLTLGAPRTAEQSALDDHLRRQGWEVGNIDYLGRDSFDNIWSKICETLSAGTQTEAPKAPEATTPSPSDTALSEESVREASSELPEKEVSKTVSETSDSISVKQTDSVVSQPPEPVKQEIPSTEPPSTTQSEKEPPTQQAPSAPQEPTAPQVPEPSQAPQQESAPAPIKTEGTQVAQEAAAAPVQETPAPAAPVQETPAPAPPTPAPAQEASAPAPPAQETPAPAQEAAAPAQEAAAPAQQAPAPAQETPAPAQAAPTPVSPVQEVPAPAASVQEVPAPAAPVQEVPAPPEVPTPAAPVQEVPPPATPVQEVPAPAAPVQEVPAPAAPAQEVPAPPAPVQEVPAPPAPVQEVPAPAAPVQEVPAPAAPVQEVPAPATPVKEVPAPAAPVQEVPAPTPPVQEVPAPAAPVQEPPAAAETPVEGVAAPPVQAAPAKTEEKQPQEAPPQPKPTPVKKPPSKEPEQVPAPKAEVTQTSPPQPATETQPSAPPAAPEAPASPAPPSPAGSGSTSEAKPAGEPEQSKKSPAAKAEAGSTLPTPPPRKTGGKKTKSKK